MSNRTEQMAMEGFTPKEKRVAALLFYGKSRSEIAAILNVSENTVKTHVQNIFKKADVKSQKAFMSKYLINGGGQDGEKLERGD